MASARDELQRLAAILSEYECGHLLGAVRKIAAGDRFWEGDIGVFYNEHVKARHFNIDQDLASVIPGDSSADTGIFAPIPITRFCRATARVRLPNPERIEATVSDVMLQRRSRRNYSGEALLLGELSTLLHHACGATGSFAGYDYARFPLRTFPSSGGLQAPEVYLSVQAIDGVTAGLYHYHPVDHALDLLRSGDFRHALRELALGQPYVDTAAVVFLITGYYERLRWKYGERAYRYMCMDTGFLSENVYLTAEALGLGACAIAGFVDDAFEELLAIDGQDEIALLLLTIGRLQQDEGS